MLDNNVIFDRAYNECMTEMYAKAQPPADYNQYLQDAKDGKITRDEKVYERHYLSHEEFKYILEKYIEAYHFKEKWRSNIEVLEGYLIKGGNKDKYIEAHTDAHGNYHPGYRSYEEVLPIKKQFVNIFTNSEFYTGSEMDDAVKELVKELTDTVLNTISECKEYYRFDRKENEFAASVALGPSPCSNKETVIEYWKSQGIDIEIEERNPLLLWDMDYYGDSFEEVMEDEYGEDWKQQWDAKWEEEKREKDERLKKLKQKLNE